MKKLVCICLCLLMLAGCSKETPEATVSTTQPSTTTPTPTGVYLLKEQIHYDASGRESVRMEVTFNTENLPTTVFLDSGADVTYTLQYNDNNGITGFSAKQVLYGEETETSALVNEYGDIIQKTAGDKVTNITCSYDGGKMVKKETSVNGNLSSVKTWSYDQQGNLKEVSSTDANGGYTLIYENTYDGALLNAVHCKFEGGETEHTEAYTYDEQQRLIRWEHVSGEEASTTVYTYNEADLVATETNLLNGEEYSRLEYSYDDRGLLTEKLTYSYGELSGRTTYTWVDQPVLLTAAQRNILKQLSVIL